MKERKREKEQPRHLKSELHISLENPSEKCSCNTFKLANSTATDFLLFPYGQLEKNHRECQIFPKRR